MKQTKTIAAIATPNGKSALAVVRLSGPDAFEIVTCCIKEKEKFDSAPARTIGLYTLFDFKKTIPLDEVTAIKYSAPRSFTGENMVEIICHGGPRIVEEIAAVLIEAGATPAGRGDFSHRAFINGKMDLLRAEAIMGMIESSGDVDLACARKLYSHDRTFINRIREKVIEISADVEAAIEFDEEGDVDKTSNISFEKTKEIIATLEKEIRTREKIKDVENFLTVVIAGPTNAGKSSLFNLLLGKGRSIVHSEAGTTRDLISEIVWLCGHQIALIDSAGIRATNHEIEKEGILRSREAMEKASLILWVTDASRALSNEELDEIMTLDKEKVICVINKTDLSSGNEKKCAFENLKIESMQVSIKGKTKTDAIIDKIAEKIELVEKNIEIPDIFLNKRQESIGKELYQELCCARDEWERPEIAAHHLKAGIRLLDEIFGKTENEEILNRIFSSFCIGK